jgi:hypothetical protein
MEMSSWEMLQLEPISMRDSDNLHDPPELTSKGGKMPATLYNLANTPSGSGFDKNEEAVYQQIGNRLADLIDELGRLCALRKMKQESC